MNLLDDKTAQWRQGINLIITLSFLFVSCWSFSKITDHDSRLRFGRVFREKPFQSPILERETSTYSCLCWWWWSSSSLWPCLPLCLWSCQWSSCYKHEKSSYFRPFTRLKSGNCFCVSRHPLGLQSCWTLEGVIQIYCGQNELYESIM